jgi:hypothetical protein
MKISPESSSFSTSGDVDVDVDGMSERNSQDNNNSGVQRAPSIETSSFQAQMLAKMDAIAAKCSEDRTGKESELARCVVELAQANERLTTANERLTGQVSNLSLQFARHDTTALPSNGAIDNLVTQVKNLHDSLQTASEERNDLKQSIIASQHQDFSNLKEECAQLKSELSDVKNDCESSIAGLKAEVAPRTTQSPMVQPVKECVWKSSRDVCVSGIHYAELLECPPMNSGIHKWSIFVEKHHVEKHRVIGDLSVGVASTVHSLEENNNLWRQEGGWAYDSHGEALHSGRYVKMTLPTFQKGSKVTFVLDLTGEGTLSASVDGKSFHQLFSDMCSKVRSVDPEGGFVPAVGLNYAGQKVRFLGFERGST